MHQWHLARSGPCPLRPRGQVVWGAPPRRPRTERRLPPAVLHGRHRLGTSSLASRRWPPGPLAGLTRPVTSLRPPRPNRPVVPGLRGSAATLPELLAEAREELRALEREWRAANREHWHRWCTDEWLVGGRKLYGWIRRDPVAPTPVEEDLPPLGSPEDLARLDAYWQGLWTSPPGDLDLADWLGPLGALPRMGELSPSSLPTSRRSSAAAPSARRRVRTGGLMPTSPRGPRRRWSFWCSSMPSSSVVAAGPSRGPATRFVSCPREAPGPPGPPTHRAAVGGLPPVGGGPRQAFPALSPCPWPAAAPHPRRGRTGGLLGLHLDVSAGEGQAVAGLTVDWSKCYDRLPLAALEAAAVAAGLPAALWRPMLAAYRLPRLVRADGLGGPSQSPLCGLAPGCPAATDWLALGDALLDRAAPRLGARLGHSCLRG